MGLFTPKKKTLEVTFIEEKIIIIKGERYHHHEHHLQEINNKLSFIINKLNKMAATLADFKAKFAEINEATNNIAADIDRLAGQLGTPGLPDADAQEALTELSGISDSLKAIAAKTPDGVPTPPVE